ncbi:MULTISPECIES: diadenosine tetraphosphate hydrolase [unclassified Streptomyces]|uniref:HIT family protein n=1 Tax=unclassified Streptomyces TaxID=2593676 RepID=UPI002DDAB420|nr:diadenosine tetraphosphate hydrolase [Streptomyces sp. NBC_01750]WSB04948.1 diadenosine tetraphosphate hydrolase [Streptomyces sp. NBC_01794]WSD30777.1 diadenosine tetraphosphate hydrolase [Streptomyces sp. NBC_01750]
MSDDWRMDRIGSALRGENPAVLRRLEAGFAVLGDVQFLPGYSVLLADDATVQRLSDLPRARRLAFLSDMDQLGEAVERACARLDPAFRRVNLEILGNTDGFLHAHVWPRFEWEPAELVSMPVWLYPRERWSDEQFGLSSQHDVLREAIGEELDQLQSAH